jgi:WD40 repeat protein
VAVTPDASLVAAGNFNGNCYFWSPGSEGAREFVPVKKLRAHRAYITACRLSPDARYFATASSDRTLKLWNTHDFSLATTLAGHARWVWDAAFSADSSFIVTASSDMTAKLWDWEKGWVCVQTYEGHMHYVMMARVAPADHTLDAIDQERVALDRQLLAHIRSGENHLRLLRLRLLLLLLLQSL